MSEEALAPTLSNFDAIVAANSAKAEAKPADDAPDTFENDTDTGIPDEADEVEDTDEAEAPDEDDSGDDEADEAEEDNDPLRDSVEQALKAPFKAFRQSLKEKRVTPELMSALGDLEFEVETVNGPAKLRLSEMGGHVMREARFSREMAKTKEDQAKAHHIMQTHQALTNAWRQSPAELARGLEIYGCQEALNVLHRQWAEETYAYLNASPQEKQAIAQRKQYQAALEQERMQRAQMARELQQLKQQNAPVFDEPTRQAGDFIQKNMDPMIIGALKSENAGKITDDIRLAFVNEVTELGQEGYPLEVCMKQAAKTVALKQRRMREMANLNARKAEAAKPKEVSGKRAPAGGAPPKRDGDGRFKPPTRSASNGKRKGPATAAAFGERFGV